MADIAPQPFINYGASMASQENTMANTAVTGEQAKQAAMDTQIKQASMPLIMGALKDATSDQSGMNSGNPDAGGVASPGAREARADRSGVDWYQGDNIEDSLRSRNYVSPYNQQELGLLKYGSALSIADPVRGKAILDRMQAQRQARIDMNTAQNQFTMGNLYDGVDAVVNAPPGSAPDVMRSVAPTTMATIERLAKGEGVDLDTETRKYAKHVAVVAHMYAGRPTKMENGVQIDEKSGKQVTGQDQVFTGLTSEQRQKEFDRATEQVEWTTPDNVAHKDERWRTPVEYGGYGGKITPAQAVLAADQAARQGPAGAAHPPGEVATAAASGTGPVMHGRTASARVTAKAAAVKAAASQPTGANIAAGTAPATANDSGALPGVNPAQLPKAANPTAGQGPGSAGTLGTKNLENLGTRTDAAITTTREASADAAKMRSLIAQASAEVQTLDPRTVGPGSTLYNTALRVYTAAAGKAPNALIDETTLDKFLNQIGAQNVRQLLAGQRITNQEMMTFLTRGSPSTSMPLGGIQKLLNYLDADNEYTLRYNRTKMMGLKSNADPDLIDQELEGRVHRAEFVKAKTGSADALIGEPAKSKWSDEQITAYAAAQNPPISETEARRFLTEHEKKQK